MKTTEKEKMMLSILVAVDGSEPSLRAVRHAAKLAVDRSAVKIHLLNVQIPLPAAASGFLSEKDVRGFHMDEGDAALREARAILDDAGVPYEAHVAVGQIAEAIADYAEERDCSQILMSTRGLGPISGLLLGSVATKVLHLANVPVTFVK